MGSHECCDYHTVANRRFIIILDFGPRVFSSGPNGLQAEHIGRLSVAFGHGSRVESLSKLHPTVWNGTPFIFSMFYLLYVKSTCLVFC